MKEEQKNIQEELQGLSSRLAKLHPKDDGFSVPEGYFAQTADDFFRRKEEATQKSAGLRILYLRRIAAAAVVILATGIWLFSGKTNSQTPETDFFAGISDAEIKAYIEENIHEFETATLLESGAELTLSDENWLPAFENAESSATDKLLDELMNEIDPYDFEDFF